MLHAASGEFGLKKANCLIKFIKVSMQGFGLVSVSKVRVCSNGFWLFLWVLLKRVVILSTWCLSVVLLIGCCWRGQVMLLPKSQSHPTSPHIHKETLRKNYTFLSWNIQSVKRQKMISPNGKWGNVDKLWII